MDAWERVDVVRIKCTLGLFVVVIAREGATVDKRILQYFKGNRTIRCSFSVSGVTVDDVFFVSGRVPRFDRDTAWNLKLPLQLAFSSQGIGYSGVWELDNLLIC